MGLLGMIDAELQKDLIDFIKEQEAKPHPHVLGDSLITYILNTAEYWQMAIKGWMEEQDAQTDQPGK